MNLKKKNLEWIYLGAIVVLYVTLRHPWVGHLLSVDEGNTLCAVRTFASGGQDYFMGWFWHRPPALKLLMLLLHPLEEGFAERVQMALILTGVLTLSALYLLNRHVFGKIVALWSVFLFAVAPAAVFYDVWIKQELIMGFFSLLAVYYFIRDRFFLAGLLLGLAFLAKELALFYAVGIGLMWLFRPRPRIRALLVTMGTAFMVSIWWFVFFSNFKTQTLAFIFGTSGTPEQGWKNPWYFFLLKLPVDMGWIGLVALLIGVGALFVTYRKSSPAGRASLIWPLGVGVFGFLVISLMKGKTPWYTASLLPSMVTLAGLGIAVLLSGIKKIKPALVPVLSLVIGLIFLLPVWGRDYEETMRQQYYGMWWGADQSRAAARTLNRLVGDDEKIIITPLAYWDSPHPHPDGIFVYYLKPMPVLIKKINVPLDVVVRNVKDAEIDWVLLSRPPQVGGGEDIAFFDQQYGIAPIRLAVGNIFRTTSIYKDDISVRAIEK